LKSDFSPFSLPVPDFEGCVKNSVNAMIFPGRCDKKRAVVTEESALFPGAAAEGEDRKPYGYDG
jgi:hypothetical protein